MENKKKLLALLLILTLLAAVVVGLVWHWQNYVMVGFSFYPRNEAVLDLRSEELTLEKYEKIQAKIPDTRIVWMVPVQGGHYDLDARELTLEHLAEEDLLALQYLTKLESIDAEACVEYDLLGQLQELLPQTKVNYHIPMGGTRYNPMATRLSVSSMTEEELGNLKYLTKLDTVVLTGCETPDQLKKLQEISRERGLTFELSIGGENWPVSTQEMTVTGAGNEVLELMTFLPELKKLHLVDPVADAAALCAMQQERSDLELTWEMTFSGQTYPWDLAEVDLSAEEVTDLAAVEAMMEYFPKAEKLILGRFSTPEEGRGEYEMWEHPLTNQDLADYRERVRDKYKVAWTVQVGRKLTARTDDTTFRPDSHGVGRLFNDEVYNLRYCEDMICIDVGHMSFSDLSWAAYMPHLKYLIIAWTGVRDLTPLGNLKELVYLEVDWSPIQDYSPLVGCTALEDLNIGSTYADTEPLTKMTWLKNLWMIFCPSKYVWKVMSALPDTRIANSGSATVASGWRRLPNYYAQRDLLNMYYMN